MKNKLYIDDKEFNLIIEYKKVKNINLRIKKNYTIYVSSPYKVSYKNIEDILYQNKEWILKNSLKFEENIEEKNKILYLGKYYNLYIKENSIDRIDIKKDNMILYSRDMNKDYIDNLIYKWYYNEAYRHLFNEVETLSKRLELYPNKVYIGNQKTLWGSCNSKKHIRLNWRLILMPKSVRDYIIIHELCHITHMNHSTDFWNLVSIYDTQYKQNKLWLKSEGKKLMNIF